MIRKPYELQSKLLVSAVITPSTLPYIILLGGSRLIKNLGASELFKGFEGLEVICGVFQAAILDAKQMLGRCTYKIGECSDHNVVHTSILESVILEHTVTRAPMPKQYFRSCSKSIR